MDLRKLQKNWNTFGKIDPLWSNITFPSKKNRRWQLDEFFATGVREINAIMEHIKLLNLDIPRRKALDFGCGVGRLTQALAHFFDKVYSVDIAPSMITLAKKYNRHGDKCRYYLNESDDLKIFFDNSFDLIYSNITLQHIEPRYSKSYLKEFLRILNPQGLLIFQLPSHRSLWCRLRKSIANPIKHIIPLKLKRAKGQGKNNEPIMELYCIKRKEVTKYLEENGAKIIDVKRNQATGKSWVSFVYFVVKKQKT